MLNKIVLFIIGSLVITFGVGCSNPAAVESGHVAPSNYEPSTVLITGSVKKLPPETEEVANVGSGPIPSVEEGQIKLFFGVRPLKNEPTKKTMEYIVENFTGKDVEVHPALHYRTKGALTSHFEFILNGEVQDRQEFALTADAHLSFTFNNTLFVSKGSTVRGQVVIHTTKAPEEPGAMEVTLDPMDQWVTSEGLIIPSIHFPGSKMTTGYF